jgi:hypothetical protein
VDKKKDHEIHEKYKGGANPYEPRRAGMCPEHQ